MSPTGAAFGEQTTTNRLCPHSNVQCVIARDPHPSPTPQWSIKLASPFSFPNFILSRQQRQRLSTCVTKLQPRHHGNVGLFVFWDICVALLLRLMLCFGVCGRYRGPNSKLQFKIFTIISKQTTSFLRWRGWRNALAWPFMSAS